MTRQWGADEGSGSGLRAGEVWLILAHPRPNTLLIGSPRALARVLEALRGKLVRPIVEHDCAQGFCLPAEAGTLVLRNVHLLDETGQHALNHWLAGPGRTVQVITVLTAALFPFVERGRFFEDLYYRLNTLLLSIE